jgi:hypothetical protein
VPELPLVVDNSLAGVVKTSAAYEVQYSSRQQPLTYAAHSTLLTYRYIQH